MKNDCNGLNLMTQALQEDGCRTPRTIHVYREQLWNCIVDCGGLHKDCKEAVLYFMNKAWNILDLKT